jgi:hypothetical protein
MKKMYFLVLLAVAVLINGCATTGPVKHSDGSNIAYTDASREIAFDASIEALQKLGYKIEIKDQENFYVKGSYWNPLTEYAPVNAQIDISQETSGAKIVNSIHLAGGYNLIGVASLVYTQRAENIYKEEAKILAAKGYKVQKSR